MSTKQNDFQKMYSQIREQQQETKNSFMRDNYDKLPSWSRQELTSSGLGSQHATSGVLESLCKSVQQRFDEDKEKFMKENSHKLPSWSKH